MRNSLPPAVTGSVGDDRQLPIGGTIRAVDALDTLLLDRIQTELPLVERPYEALADAIGSDEETVLARVAALREQKVIRQISAIFDSRRLGYRGMLVAARMPEERQDDAAAVFSSHPGVSHNYLREHELNVWFTLTVSPRSRLGLDRTVELLGELAQVDVIRPMPALRFFKIGVDLDVKGDRDPAAKLVKPRPVRKAPPPEALTDRELDAIRALQRDLAVESEPFREVAARAGFDQAELLELGHAFLETGQMRRYAAVLAHRNAGFVQNGMGVWRVPEERLDECGRTMAAFRGVSHCYQRPTYPDWPYNLFSMTHGRTKADCEAVLAAVGAETGLDDYSVLYSTKEYKKTRVSYFTPEEAAWEQTHAALSV
jgi:siroheme decarboxylase